MLTIGQKVFYGQFREPGTVTAAHASGIYRIALESGREVNAPEAQVHTAHPAALAAALDHAKSEGATHYARPMPETIFAYRPAPGFPGQYGEKVYILRGAEAHTGEPWILRGPTLPTYTQVNTLREDTHP